MEHRHEPLLVDLSVDLVANSIHLTKLLHAVDTWPNGGLHNKVWAENAVQRYNEYWMPMLAAAPYKERDHMIPPLDVAFVWLVHRLMPIQYQKDCEAWCGRMLDPAEHMSSSSMPMPQALAFSDGSDTLSLETKSRWNLMFSGEQPYFPPKSYNVLCGKAEDPFHKPKPHYGRYGCVRDVPGLVSAVMRQTQFLHHILRPAYLEEPFLRMAHTRYCRFLELCKNRNQLGEAPGGRKPCLVPMIDIELLWHTHMALSSSYRRDTTKFMGAVLKHDDSIEDSLLQQDFAATKQVYEKTYNEMYDPPITQSIQESVRHPLEIRLGHVLLQTFKVPSQRTSLVTRFLPAQQRQAAAVTGHAGGHAMYAAWLLNHQLEQAKGSLWHRLRGPDHVREVTLKEVLAMAMQFSAFKDLPTSMSHPYWQLYQLVSKPMKMLPKGVAKGMPAVAAGTPVTSTLPQQQQQHTSEVAAAVGVGSNETLYHEQYSCYSCYSCHRAYGLCNCRASYCATDLCYLWVFNSMCMSTNEDDDAYVVGGSGGCGGGSVGWPGSTGTIIIPPETTTSVGDMTLADIVCVSNYNTLLYDTIMEGHGEAWRDLHACDISSELLVAVGDGGGGGDGGCGKAGGGVGGCRAGGCGGGGDRGGFKDQQHSKHDRRSSSSMTAAPTVEELLMVAKTTGLLDLLNVFLKMV